MHGPYRTGHPLGPDATALPTTRRCQRARSALLAARSDEKIARCICRRPPRLLRWNGRCKVRQIDSLHPHLREAAVSCIAHNLHWHARRAAENAGRCKGLAGVVRRDRAGELIKKLRDSRLNMAGDSVAMISCGRAKRHASHAEATTGSESWVTCGQTRCHRASFRKSALHYVIRKRHKA